MKETEEKKNKELERYTAMRNEERLMSLRNYDSSLVAWIYQMDALARTDEALQFLDDNPMRITIWLDERRS